MKKNENEYLWGTEILTKLELIVDSTEQARERPSEYQKQTDCYSGKKSNHIFKSQYIITPKGTDIVDILVGERGPERDINLLRKLQKIFRVAKERFRLKEENYEKVMMTVCGLVRLRIRALVLV